MPLPRRKLFKFGFYSLGMLINNILGANLKSQAQANSLPRTPKQDGFYFPAEWHPHEYTIMQFVPLQTRPFPSQSVGRVPRLEGTGVCASSRRGVETLRAGTGAQIKAVRPRRGFPDLGTRTKRQD